MSRVVGGLAWAMRRAAVLADRVLEVIARAGMLAVDDPKGDRT